MEGAHAVDDVAEFQPGGAQLEATGSSITSDFKYDPQPFATYRAGIAFRCRLIFPPLVLEYPFFQVETLDKLGTIS